jgi:ATP-binding cassette subfamily B protein
VAHIRYIFIQAAPHVLGQLLNLLGALVLILLTSVRLTLVMLVSVPLTAGLTALFGRLLRGISSKTQDELADTNVIVEETLQGIAVVKAFTNEQYERSRYRSGISALITTVLRGARYQAAYGAFVALALFGSLVLVLWYGARLVQSRELALSDVIQFMLYTAYIAGAVGSFANVYGDLQRLLGATTCIRELLREPTEQAPARPAAGPSLSGRAKGAIAFEGVTFSYPARPGVEVLRDLSLRAEPGQRIALVGPSGAGKSTIVALLLRFYEAGGGRVLIDGRDVRACPLLWLREQMAIVPQDVLLFGGTIAENIAYGRPGAAQAEVEDAARKANAHDFITRLPERYDTVVGERGMQLSCGQRQRVAIARALLRDPAILILDEATSSLDSESERLVQQAVEALLLGRTSVIIAHRLATVRRADCIYVIKDGQAVEAGTHDELRQRPRGLYRTLSELQFDAAENGDRS